MKCLKTNSKINDENWLRQPVCNCNNCQKFFRKLIETYQTGDLLKERMVEAAKD